MNPDGTLQNPFPYSQYSYGTQVSIPTYYVAGVEKFVLEPARVPGQINTPIWLQPPTPSGFWAWLASHGLWFK